MEFSNTTTKTGALQQIEKLTGLGDGVITGNATYLKQFTGDVNNAYSRVANIILRVDGRMQWDDPNHSNAPASDADLISGQKKYEVFEALPTALQDWLQVEKVEILSEDDLGLSLKPIDILDIVDAESEFRDVNGTPEYFDFDGAEVKLYPSPDYAKTDGLTIFFKRSPSYFASTDTTKVPGFATLYHELLPLWASYWWGVSKGLGYVRNVRAEITVLETELKKFYTRRPKFERLILEPEEVSFK
ncbi:hypothetical protein GQ568_03465 [Patescibacteria group bacterium]|nr:hypothetical protein [Patescibacteria group bacterium]